MKEPLLRTLVRKAINEAEVTAGPENTKFTLRTGVNKNPTKLGIKVQFEPTEGMLDNDTKAALEVALQEKLNDNLKEYDIQVSKDTDVPREDVIGFFIPLSQIKNLIVQGITGKSPEKPTVPAPGPTGGNNNRPTPEPDTDDDEDNEDEITEQEDPLDRAAKLAKEPLPGYMSTQTGLGLKRKGYEQEEGGELTLEELYEKLGTAYELLVDIFKDIYGSDYKFKTYYENNEDEITRTMGAIAMMKDDVEDRIKVKEPVDDKGIEEIKNFIRANIKEIQKVKRSGGGCDECNTVTDNCPEGQRCKECTPASRHVGWGRCVSANPIPTQDKEKLNEVSMKVRELNEISKVVKKEDFYEFINNGNNILRTLEENNIPNPKKYLEYLVKNNIM